MLLLGENLHSSYVVCSKTTSSYFFKILTKIHCSQRKLKQNTNCTIFYIAIVLTARVFNFAVVSHLLAKLLQGKALHSFLLKEYPRSYRPPVGFVLQQLSCPSERRKYCGL